MSIINGSFAAINDEFTLQLDPIQQVLSFNFFQDAETGVQNLNTTIDGLSIGFPFAGFQYNVVGDQTSEIYVGATITVTGTNNGGGENDGTFVITAAQFSSGNTHFQWAGMTSVFGTPYGNISTGSRFFKKEYRYSRDSVIFTPWVALTDPSLQAIAATVAQPYWFEIRYTRIGTDTTGVLEWNYFYLDVTVEAAGVGCPTFFPTVFSNPNLFGSFCTNNIDFLKLCGNLTDKLIKYGIEPKFISLKETKERSQDYIDFWHAICCFFSLHFILAKQFADIFVTRSLLADYLTQRGLFLCGDETLLEIQTLAKTYYDEIRKRGTTQVAPEVKRLLCIDECDEFIFAFVGKYEGGWVVDKASPMYSGFQGIKNMNKMIEKGNDVVDLNNYHLSNAGAISIVTDATNEGLPVDVMQITNAVGGTGIIRQGQSEFKMVVDPALADPRINYEISFLVKQEVLGAHLSFGVSCFDCDGNEITNPTVDIQSGADEQYFFRNADHIKIDDKYVLVRGIIYNKDEPLKTGQDVLLNIGFGNNLRFKEEVVYVYPIIRVEGAPPVNSTKIYGVRVAMCSGVYSLGFIGLVNFIIMIFKNNNANYSTAQIQEIINRYLIPANSVTQIVVL
jgi:hypothetical protein